MKHTVGRNVRGELMIMRADQPDTLAIERLGELYVPDTKPLTMGIGWWAKMRRGTDTHALGTQRLITAVQSHRGGVIRYQLDGEEQWTVDSEVEFGAYPTEASLRNAREISTAAWKRYDESVAGTRECDDEDECPTREQVESWLKHFGSIAFGRRTWAAYMRDDSLSRHIVEYLDDAEDKTIVRFLQDVDEELNSYLEATLRSDVLGCTWIELVDLVLAQAEEGGIDEDDEDGDEDGDDFDF